MPVNRNGREDGVCDKQPQKKKEIMTQWRLPGQRRLGGCRLWGRKESDATEATQQQRTDGPGDGHAE